MHARYKDYNLFLYSAESVMERTFGTITRRIPTNTNENLRATIKKIFKDFRGTIMQKYAHTHTPPNLYLR